MQPKSIVKNENKKSEEKIIKAIEEIKIRDIKKLFEQEDSYKPLRVGIFLEKQLYWIWK